MINIEHNSDKKQFIARVEGKSSTLDYRVSADKKILDYYSTFVPEELRGRNIGQELVRWALIYAREHNYKIKPSCPFVNRYIERHPEFDDLI